MSRHKIHCPHCEAGLNVEPQLEGRSVKCPGCHEQFVVQFNEPAVDLTSEWEEPAPETFEKRIAPPVLPPIPVSHAANSDAAIHEKSMIQKASEAVVRGAWLLCGLFTLLTASVFTQGLRQANGAPQQAAIGAIAAASFVGAYVLTRCIEEFVTPRGHR